jgi:hypothetical protein
MEINEDVHIRGQLRTTITGNTDAPTGVIGGWQQVGNDGTGQRPTGNGGYRSDYNTRATRGTFDVGHVITSRIESPSCEGAYEGQWHVGCSPKTPHRVGKWSYFETETNVGSFVDAGYQENINGPHPTGGHLMVSIVPGAFGPLGSSKNVTFAFAVAGAPGRQDIAQFYNGIIINPDSIAVGGRGIQAGGAKDNPAYAPFAPMEVTKIWASGIRLERARIRDGKAMNIAATQKITRENGTEAVFLTRRQINKLKRLLAAKPKARKGKSAR